MVRGLSSLLRYVNHVTARKDACNSSATSCRALRTGRSVCSVWTEKPLDSLVKLPLCTFLALAAESLKFISKTLFKKKAKGIVLAVSS